MSTTIAVAEVAKLLLQGYFTMIKQKGISEEEAKQLYEKTKAEFDKNSPDLLEDV